MVIRCAYHVRCPGYNGTRSLTQCSHSTNGNCKYCGIFSWFPAGNSAGIQQSSDGLSSSNIRPRQSWILSLSNCQRFLALEQNPIPPHPKPTPTLMMTLRRTGDSEKDYRTANKDIWANYTDLLIARIPGNH